MFAEDKGRGETRTVLRGGKTISSYSSHKIIHVISASM